MMVASHVQRRRCTRTGGAAAVSPRGRLLDSAAACALTPVLRAERVIGAVYEPDASDMDVHAIHQGFLRGIRRAGGGLLADAPVGSLHREGGVWQVQAGAHALEAPLVVNAAGAWSDAIGMLAGARPIGLQPKRRSAFIFAPPERGQRACR